MGHFSPQQLQAATMALAMVTPELEKLKMMPVVHTELYLDVLNRLIEPLAIKQGFDGRVTWLGEVQLLIIRLKQRSCAGVPLHPRERQCLVWYSQRWRALRGGPCDMGRPEAQIILITLGELARF